MREIDAAIEIAALRYFRHLAGGETLQRLKQAARQACQVLADGSLAPSAQEFLEDAARNVHAATHDRGVSLARSATRKIVSPDW